MFKFISKIQNSDEETRKIWMFVFSAVTMAMVVGLWLFYVNVSIGRPDPPATAGKPAGSNQFAGQVAPPPSVVKKEKISEGPGFFAIFSAGVKVIYDQFKMKVFDATNDISIENIDRNFQAEGVEVVPVTTLP